MSGKHFIARVSWTLVDQCVVSGGNFLLNILLARTLAEEYYGEFSLFLGVIFLLRAIDFSLISYPVSIRLGVASDEERAVLLGNTAALAAGLSLVLLVLMAVGAVLLETDNILIPACLCFLCWQAQETSRRFLLGDFRFREAVAGDAVAYVGAVPLIALLLWSDSVTIVSAIYAMSAAFAAGALVHMAKLRIAWPVIAELRRLALEYISVGKWSLVSYEMAILRVQLFPWLLATAAGTAATASLQAGLNIANMMNPVIFGIGNAIPQIAAQAHRSGGVLGASRAASAYVLVGLGPILVICAVGVLFPNLILHAVYGSSSPYLAVAVGLQILAVAGVLDYIAEMISKTLLGVRSGRLAFLVTVVSALTALVMAVLLIGPLGMVGACLGLLIANLVRVICAVAALAWLILREKAQEEIRLAKISSTAATPQIVRAPAES